MFLLVTFLCALCLLVSFPPRDIISPMSKPKRGSESASSLHSELHISPKPVIIILVVIGMALISVGERMPASSDRVQVHFLVVLLYVASAVAWLLDDWRPWAGRWFTLIILVAVIFLSHSWLGVQGTLTLLAVPTALAVAMLGLAVATGTAAVETLLLLLWSWGRDAAGVDRATVVIALIAVWAILGVMVAVCRPMGQLSRWLWEYFQRVQGLLEEARNRAAELEQTLDELAHTNRQLALANERLAALRLVAEEAQKTKAAFVAKVSHEFRTPLNMIVGLVDLLVEMEVQNLTRLLYLPMEGILQRAMI